MAALVRRALLEVCAVSLLLVSRVFSLISKYLHAATFTKQIRRQSKMMLTRKPCAVAQGITARCGGRSPHKKKINIECVTRFSTYGETFHQF